MIQQGSIRFLGIDLHPAGQGEGNPVLGVDRHHSGNDTLQEEIFTGSQKLVFQLKRGYAHGIAMTSFDYAYTLEAVRDWLFAQSVNANEFLSQVPTNY